MQWYKVTLSMSSPSGTPWQADTIFGHLCWRLRHNQGDKTLSNFLEWFLAGQPALLLSDGFPDELLPKPLLFALPRSEGIGAFDQAKETKKQVFLSRKDFTRAIHGDLFIPEKQDEKVDGTLRIDVRNQINRTTGTTGGEGQLYSFSSHWIRTVSIYLKIERGFETLVEELFTALKDTGYGKRKSVGYGAIEQVRMEAFPGFPVPPDANAFVSLSSFVPAESDPVRARH
jgi:CRISPR-associated protein Csm4